MFAVNLQLFLCNCSIKFWLVKNLILILEQFMPVIRKSVVLKTALKQASERNGTSSNSQPALNFATPPLLHRPSPDLPVINDYQFQIALLAYLTLAMFIQYLNIYKTNFYEIDLYMIAFLMIVLLRHIGWLLLKQTLASEVIHTFGYWSRVCMKATLLLLIMAMCFWSLFNVMQTSAIEDLLFLCYPFAIYIWTFGCSLNVSNYPLFYKLGTHQTKLVQNLLLENASLFYQAISLQVPVNVVTQVSNMQNTQNKENNISSQKNNTNINKYIINGYIKSSSISSCQDHCAMSPDSVRYETECLRNDFNLRMKQILFNSVVSTYYVAFIPLKFTQNKSLFFDKSWAIQHILFVFVSVFVFFMNFMVPHHYIDGLHKCALHLGGWEVYNGQRETPHIWSPLTIWPHSALVHYNKGVFRALEKQNTAVPGDKHHSRFYFIFKSPVRLLTWLAALQFFTVIYQLYVMTYSSLWYQCLSMLPITVFSYFLLFRLLRERWAVQAIIEEHALCSMQS
ncbi:transmembrane protein 39A isoform X1 [Hydra vulgaris]|uniref:transmembrane protein 39A isoform X1 n=1 Tax=Hydra vulgaris TaxID=6087 RepID=UPI00064115A9|nr:transmembrane protein 39A [Hydra vulgaris]XP_047128667.1 transmembrane protein 39A [Hydra vulgaris]